MDTNKHPAPRTPLFLEVGFKRNYAREDVKGILKNISLSGAFLEFQGDSPKANEKLYLRFVVSGRERKIAAAVVWGNSHGCGIRFMPANNRDVQIVDDLIYYVENSREGRRDVLDKIFKKVS
ncbi:MAG TPA: PilZ domain-containing protein [Pseudobdellovibrionaceae bacterium]